MSYYVALSEEHDRALRDHLLACEGQEDLCFALYNLSTGASRQTAVIKELILPEADDRELHGNVSFTAQYFDRVTRLALERNCGICFMHCHFAKGWQDMSRDDVAAEQHMGPRVKAVTGLPLFGLTLSTDGFWSARAWLKEIPKIYRREDCAGVRVIGKGLRISIYEKRPDVRIFSEAFIRTISAWGEKKQALISELRVCIVGLGSVGSIVAEALIKTGVRHLTLIDFDIVKLKNLDRLNGIGVASVGKYKVTEMRDYLIRIAADPDLHVSALIWSIIEKEGLLAALDNDLIFSCVDRPWPRYILNAAAYASLIPVIDGGIDSSANKRHDNLDQARWKAHVVGPERRCLCCLEQYKPEDVALEQSGLLEDPHYIKDLPPDHFIHRGENVFAFSLGLAGMEMQQFLSLLLKPRGQYCGPKEYNFNAGNIDSDFPFGCNADCEFATQLQSQGDKVNKYLPARHLLAEEARAVAAKPDETVPSIERNVMFAPGRLLNQLSVWTSRWFKSLVIYKKGV